jgi:hypothetical protein
MAMTRTEREDLGKILRQQAKVAQKLADQRKAELIADVEEQLARVYRTDEEHMKDLADRAREAAAQIDSELAERCKELGVPPTFRPQVHFAWSGRGENGFEQRRRELRKVAMTRIDAMARKAAVEVETATLDAAIRLAADGLQTVAASEFLAGLPTVEAMMQPFRIEELALAPPARMSRPSGAVLSLLDYRAEDD